MAINYINEDYSIKLYEKNSEQQEIQVAQRSILETTSTIEQQVEVLESFTYQEAISDTSPYDHIIYANDDLHPIITGANYGNQNTIFGHASYISGNYAAVNITKGTFEHATNNNKTGVLMLESGSSGWNSIQFLTVDNSEMPSGGEGVPSVEEFGKAWSYDRKNGRHVVIAAPLRDTSEGGAHGLKGKVFIFTTSSTGFQHVQTLTTASLPDSIKNHFQYVGDPDANGQFYTAGYHYWASTVRVDGDHISVGSLVRNNVPKTEWDNENLYTNFVGGGASTTANSPGVVMFKSSSSGFVFEKFLDGYDIEVESTTDHSYNIDNNLCHDLKDGVCIFAGNGGWQQGGWSSTNGRIRIWKTSSAGWYNEGSIDLYNLGFTEDWSATIVNDNFPSTFDNIMDNFPSWPELSRPAYSFYYHFGRAGCAVSDDCIVAVAEARGNEGYFDVNLSNRIFMIKSGSSGWNLEANFASPNTAVQGDDNSTFNDKFGRGGLAIDRGVVVAKAPLSKENNNTNVGTIAGRAYIYKSSSVSGWSLDETIDNPFSGSNPYSLTEHNSGRTRFTGATGEHAGEYPLNGYYYINQAPAVGGGEDTQFVIIPYPGLIKDTNSDSTRGGIYLIQGSSSLTQETITTTITQSSEIINYVSGTGPIPFRFSVNGVFNINEQNSGDASYATFIGDLGSKN